MESSVSRSPSIPKQAGGAWIPSLGRDPTALSELKAARHRWAVARRLRFELDPEHRAQREAALRELLRTFCTARASVRAAVRHWEALCRAYRALYSVAPA